MRVTVLDYKQGDVNGDRIPDKVYLTGGTTPESPFIQNITLVIEDGSTGRAYRFPLEGIAGYNPTLFLGDFTADGIADILVSITSGGTGGVQYHYVYSFANNRLRTLFDYADFNRAYRYRVIYRDYYRVDVISESLNKIYTLDIRYKGQDYLSAIYYKNGQLIKPLAGWVNPLGSLWPVDMERDGTYELYATQSIAGRYNADSLGCVETMLKWDGCRFAPLFQFVAIPGTEVELSV